MHKQLLIITNNPKIRTRSPKDQTVRFLKTDSLHILFAARDTIHLGHHLVSHPMAGSLKPNQTPYKTIVLSKGQDTAPFQSVNMIEQAIEAAEKFLRCRGVPAWGKKALEDFQTIDLSFIQGAIGNYHEKPKRRYAP